MALTLKINSAEDVITGREVAGLFDARIPGQETLSESERTILSTLLSSNGRVDLVIPDKMDPNELWRTLDICARVFVRVRRASGQLKLLIGRALLVIQDTPEIYTSRGFESFNDFVSDEQTGLPAMTGISRGELFKAKAVAKSVGPGMRSEDIREIGFSKVQLVAAAAPSGSPKFNALIEAAKFDTVPQLRERIANADVGLTAEDMEWATIQFPVTRTQKNIAEEFFGNPQVQAYCGTESRGVILERLIQEAEVEWQIQAMVIESEARGDLE